MQCTDPCGIITAWRLLVKLARSKAMSRKRTSIDGVIDETSLDLQSPPKARLPSSLLDGATSIHRGSAIAASELDSLYFSEEQPREVVFDAEDATQNREGDPGIVPAPPSSKTNLNQIKEDTAILEDAEIESLVSDPE